MLYSDKDGDPHSPHLDEGEGLAGVVRGLWHAHIGWLVTPERTDLDRWAPDLLKDRDLVWVHRRFPQLVAATFVSPFALGVALTGSLWGGVTALLWGALACIFLLHHVTWSINSICHFYGKRPFASNDFSITNWALSVLSFGESWHYNHHVFPISAIHGIGRGRIDLAGRLIRVFERLGWARSVKVVFTEQLQAKAQAPFSLRRGIG
jgi:stearoyl-CoA desaturase (Delta-9 desaturase)